MPALQLDVVTPGGSVVSQPVESVQARATEGYFQVLPNHTSLLTALTIGRIRYVAGGQPYDLATSGGIAEVSNNIVTILAETAEPKGNIDTDRAQAAQERAEQRLTARSDEIDIERARLALLRALNRLHVAGRG